MIKNMFKICLYLIFACLFAATSLANPKPDDRINIIINKPKGGAMPKVVGGRRKKMMKGTIATNIYNVIICDITILDQLRAYGNTGCQVLKWRIFENWCNGELPKIWHHLSDKVI